MLKLDARDSPTSQILLMSEPVHSSSVSVQGSLAGLMSWALGSAVDDLILELSGLNPVAPMSLVNAEVSPKNSLSLRCTEVLRVLPGRRVVCKAWLDGVPVVIKWFLGNRAQRYQRRELNGAALLQATSVPTPKILHSFDFTFAERQLAELDHAGCGLVFEYLAEAEELTDQHLENQPELYETLWRLLASMCEQGVVHRDLHFGNLMCKGSLLWLIDGDSVVQPRQAPLGVQESAEQFVRLAAQSQRSLSLQELSSHWESFCLGRQFDTSAIAQGSLLAKYRRARRARILHYQAKTQRNCSAFALRRTLLGEALLDRGWLRGRCAANTAENVRRGPDEAQLGRDMLAWLDDLPRLLNARDEQAGGWLKRGNTASVVAASFHGEPLIVKRYNNKSFWHRLRRMLRRDRGLNSWVYAHTLAFMGIASTEAVALLRTRLSGPTFLVMRVAKGTELSPQRLATVAAPDAFERVSHNLLKLLGQLAAEGLVHGDTKASNFLWDSETEVLTLIDLDSMRMPAWWRAMRSGHERDRRRLVRNFADTPDLQRRLGSLMDSAASNIYR